MARIGIALTHLDPVRMGGGETYCRQLVHHLQQLETDDQFVLFVGLDHGLEVDAPNFELDAGRVDPHHRHRRIAWEQAFLPRRLERQQLDLVHFPYGTLPLRQKQPSVVTILDSQRFTLPRSVPIVERCYRAVVERRISQQRHSVIGLSRWDAGVLQDKLCLAAHRVFVIPMGVSDRFRDHEDQAVPEKDDYLLWVGRPYGRKNVALLLYALQRLKAARSCCPTLRIIGVEPSHERRLRRLVKSLAIEAVVSLERPIPHDRLPEVFRRAKLFCYPSMYESFGMPVLEAMASGAPVMCADIPAFRELYEDSAILLSPQHPQPWADAIGDLLEDGQRYRELVAAGRRLARPYTWQSTARRTYDIYRRIIADVRSCDLADS